MKKNTNLSKSTLIRSIQCQKSLYLYKNFYHLRDKISKEQQARFNRGHDIGALAQQLFPGGKDVSPKSPRLYNQSLLATEYLIQHEFPIIYEAAFRYNQVLVFLDILVFKNGKFYAYEVKSSRRITPTHIQDAAIQYQVITNAGIELENISIIYVNKEYQQNDESDLDLHQLFLEQSVLQEVKGLQVKIEKVITEAKTTLQQDEIPFIEIGEHCDYPYNCDFKGFCKKNGVQ